MRVSNLYVDFQLCGGVSGPKPAIVQGSTVFNYRTKTKTNEGKGVTKQNENVIYPDKVEIIQFTKMRKG